MKNTLTILDQLIQIPSITKDLKSCQKVLDFSKQHLESLGIESRVVISAKRPILIWGQTDLNKTKTLVNTHIDVVPAPNKLFKPRHAKGRVWGRGAADTKAAAAILLANAQHWQKHAITKDITFMFVTDEEVGGDSTRLVLTKMKNLKEALFLEPLNEHVVVQSKGIIQIKITAVGSPAHGSKPWLGQSAIEKLTSKLTIFRINHPTPIQETRNTTFNFSIISGGDAINQIPSKAKLWCDVRWNPGDNSTEIIDEVKSVFNDCKVKVVKLESAINCPPDSSLKKSLQNAMKKNSLNPKDGFDHGSSDARHATKLGIPALVFGPKGENLHGDKEAVSIKSIQKVNQILNTWMLQ